MRSLFGASDLDLSDEVEEREATHAKWREVRTESGKSCSKEGKALKAECVVLGPGDRELIMDYLADRDDVLVVEGDDENEDELRDEDIVEPLRGAGDED